MKKIFTALALPRSSAFARRDFIGLSITGAVGASLVGAAPVFADGSGSTAVETCEYPTAASVLALFSVRVWQLPNKLGAAVAAKDRESEIYASFEIPFNELVALVKKLKIQCAAVTLKDPRIKELTDLADDAVNNVRFLNASSNEDKQIAYLNLVTLIAAGKQITRTAGGVAADYLPDDDSQTICKMIEKIKQMEIVKAQLDDARETSQQIFADFVNTIGLINKMIVDASQSAALFERGDTAEKAKAIVKIEVAQSKVSELEMQSSVVQDGSITTQELKMLLDVPKAMLQNKIPMVTSLNQHLPASLFENASYNNGAVRAEAAYAKIRQIIINHMLPSDWWTVRLLSLAVFGILELYGANPPRTRLVRNALQSVPWTSANSDIAAATSELVRIVI